MVLIIHDTSYQSLKNIKICASVILLLCFKTKRIFWRKICRYLCIGCVLFIRIKTKLQGQNLVPPPHHQDRTALRQINVSKFLLDGFLAWGSIINKKKMKTLRKLKRLENWNCFWFLNCKQLNLKNIRIVVSVFKFPPA